MNRGIVSLAFTLAIATAASCGRPSEVDASAEAEAVNARSQAIAAEIAQDVDGALALVAEDAVVQPAGAPQVLGKEAIAQMYRLFFTSVDPSEVTATTAPIEVSQSSDFAYEYGSTHMAIAIPEGNLLDRGKYLTVWRMLGDE